VLNCTFPTVSFDKTSTVVFVTFVAFAISTVFALTKTVTEEEGGATVVCLKRVKIKLRITAKILKNDAILLEMAVTLKAWVNILILPNILVIDPVIENINDAVLSCIVNATAVAISERPKDDSTFITIV